ncbi:MAG: sulfatase [Bacteroidota bacterium]
MKRRFFFTISLIATIVLLGSCKDDLSDERPNILFIMSDDHASHAISAYGSLINKTPQIDRIANDGIRFDNCFCTNSICAPSRAVILTGKYSHMNGVLDNNTPFNGSQQTLPKLLQKAGYETAMVGKWHLISEPTGFDYSNILPGQGDYHNPDMIRNGIRYSNQGYVTDIITDVAIEWLQGRKGSDKPFFMMLHHKAPHANWEPDDKHMEMYEHMDIPLPETFNDDYNTRAAQIGSHRLLVGPKLWELHFQRLGAIPEGMTQQETREWVYQKYMSNYLGCIASVDDNVGRILDYLEQSGISENTIVIYTSDQGFFLGDHGLYDKRFMYEHALRMPLLIRYPNKIEKGRKTEAMVLNLDFASTILDYANTPIPEKIQGESFREILEGKGDDRFREAIYYKFYEMNFGVGPHEGIRTDRHKLIKFKYGDKGSELYDLRNDPNELDNMYGSPESKLLRSSLEDEMDELKRKYQITQ